MAESIFGDSVYAFRNFCRIVQPRIEAFTNEIEAELKQRNANTGPPMVEEITRFLNLISLLTKGANEIQSLLSWTPPSEQPIVDLKLRNDFDSFLHWVSVVVTQMLHKFREGMDMGYTGKQLPRDGTVHSMTSSVVQFLRQITASKLALDVLLQRTQSNDAAVSFDTFSGRRK